MKAWLTISRSWVSSGRDSLLSTTALKDVAGEPAYLPGTSGDAVTFQPSWIEENILPVDLPVLGETRCHRAIATQLVEVFTEIEASGLSASVDVVDTRANGGCFYPRTIRGSSGGQALAPLLGHRHRRKPRIESVWFDTDDRPCGCRYISGARVQLGAARGSGRTECTSSGPGPVS